MSKIKTLLIAMIMTVASTPLLAGDGFGGVYIGAQLNSVGVELDGSYTDTDSVVTKGSGGKLAVVGGVDVGYALPLGENFLLGIGATFLPGEAEISNADDAADAADIKINADKFVTYYVQPTIAVNDNASFYLKFGETEADLQVIGDYTGTAATSLDGSYVGVGTQTLFASGFYMQAEAGVHEFDQIAINDVGNADDAGTIKGDVVADPSVASGNFTIGFKF
jgi:hypothetical protein